MINCRNSLLFNVSVITYCITASKLPSSFPCSIICEFFFISTVPKVTLSLSLFLLLSPQFANFFSDTRLPPSTYYERTNKISCNAHVNRVFNVIIILIRNSYSRQWRMYGEKFKRWTTINYYRYKLCNTYMENCRTGPTCDIPLLNFSKIL